MDKRTLVGVFIVAAVGAALWGVVSAGLPSTTIGLIESPGGENFENVPEAILPEGAIVVDDYFYTYNGGVYLNSVQSATSSRLQNIHGSSFKRLTEFAVSDNPEVPVACGEAGEYAYYADMKQLFFYQIWLTPTFKYSKLEGVIGATQEGFEVTSATSFKAGRGTYDIDFEAGTSTCKYVLKLRA